MADDYQDDYQPNIEYGVGTLPRTGKRVYKGVSPQQIMIGAGAAAAVIVVCLIVAAIAFVVQRSAQTASQAQQTQQAIAEITRDAQVVRTQNAQETLQFFARETERFRPTDTPEPSPTRRPTNTPVPTPTPDPLAGTYQEIEQAIMDYDRARRLALETGDTSDLYREATGSALQERLDALAILGGCRWRYDYQGIDFIDIEMISSTLAEVEAVLDISGTVFCGSREYDEYAFEGPVDVKYVVQNIGGEWIVSDVE